MPNSLRDGGPGAGCDTCSCHVILDRELNFDYGALYCILVTAEPKRASHSPASDPSAAFHGHAADLHAPTRTSAITCGYLDAMIMMVLINHGSGPIVGMAA